MGGTYQYAIYRNHAGYFAYSCIVERKKSICDPSQYLKYRLHYLKAAMG